MKIERGSIAHFLIQTIAIIIAGIVLYPLFDLILCKFITNSEFIYSVHKHIIQPISFGFITGIILWVVENGIKIGNSKK